MEMNVKKLKEKHDILLSYFNTVSSFPSPMTQALPLKQTSSHRSLPKVFFIKRNRISLSKTYFEENYTV